MSSYKSNREPYLHDADARMIRWAHEAAYELDPHNPDATLYGILARRLSEALAVVSFYAASEEHGERARAILGDET